MNIEWANWESLPEGQIKAFAKLFSQHQSNELIKNVTTEFKVLKISPEIYFPVTINNEEWDSSFVCSPFTAYALYSKDELLHKINNKWVQIPLLFVIKWIGKWLKWGQINKNVHVNNFLLSTNPYPAWQGAEIEAITQFIKRDFPDHAIIFRSLNRYQHQHLLDIFTAKQYKLIGSRQVYIFDLTYERWLKHKINKIDNKLIQQKNLTFLDHEDMSDYIEQALELYNKLYLQKYSKYNPQLTLEYFRLVIKKKLSIFKDIKIKTMF